MDPAERVFVALNIRVVPTPTVPEKVAPCAVNCPTIDTTPPNVAPPDTISLPKLAPIATILLQRSIMRLDCAPVIVILPDPPADTF